MAAINTIADSIIDAIRAKEEKRLSLNKIEDEYKIDSATIERWADFLGDSVSLEYPANVLSKPYLKLNDKLEDNTAAVLERGTLLDEYEISADNVSARIKILKSENDLIPLYQVILPEVGAATEAIVEGLADELTKKVPITIDDISDQRRMAKLRKVFSKEAESIIEKEFAQDIEKNPRIKNILAGILLHNCYGLGSIELLMHDDLLEEIVVNNSHTPLGAYHINYGWLRTNLFIGKEKDIFNLSSQIARKAGTNVTNLDPLMDAHLVSGDRANATLFPISTFGNTITIRKFARIPWTIISLLRDDVNTLSLDIGALLWLCMQYELNVLVTGGTASGKTSMLNAICSLIPSNQRIVSIEGTRELNLPEYLHWNWIPMATRNANAEGRGEVTMLDLITNSLRMRPDRIVMGEVRRKEEAEVLFEAMHTGHSVYSTVHADTSQHLVRRLTKPPFDLRLEDVEALDLILVQFRDRRHGLRRTLEVAEILQGSTDEKIDLNYLFRWNPRSDTFEQINESRRIFDKLNLYTGMTRDEIKDDLSEKKRLLKKMLDEEIFDIDEVGKFVGEYYKERFSFIGKQNTKGSKRETIPKQKKDKKAPVTLKQIRRPKKNKDKK